MRRPRLLFYYPIPLTEDGGSAFCLCRAIDLFKDRCDIRLLIPEKPEWESVNRRFGCHIQDGEITVETVKRSGKQWQLLRILFNCHFSDPSLSVPANRADLPVCFENYAFFGVPGIHFIVDIGILKIAGIDSPEYTVWKPPQNLLNRVQSVLNQCFHRLKKFLRLVFRYRTRFLRVCAQKGDCVIANSHWTASFFGGTAVSVKVLYPPVTIETMPMPFKNRDPDFVCLGRIAESKRIETMIEILEEVRKRTLRNITFSIAGSLDKRPYHAHIKELAARHPWIKLVGGLYGKEKESFLTSHRYAIHACQIEAFGISVAEYLKAGCIPFVPESGGPKEIVEIKDLCYSSTEDAVEKIINVLNKSDSEQASLQARLLERGKMFSLDKFDKGLITLTKEELEKRGFTGILDNAPSPSIP